MSIFSFFRSAPKPSAVQAKERLQIVMAHERVGRSGPDYLPMLQQELLAVIAKYVDIDANKVEVKLDRGGDCSTLEVNIELPSRDQIKPIKVEAKGAEAKPGTGNGKPEAGKSSTTSSVAPSAGAVLTNGGVSKRH
ncbi:MAG TPA: cell division topological specificity factor MinE [Azospirillum sp.]